MRIVSETYLVIVGQGVDVNMEYLLGITCRGIAFVETHSFSPFQRDCADAPRQNHHIAAEYWLLYSFVAICLSSDYLISNSTYAVSDCSVGYGG